MVAAQPNPHPTSGEEESAKRRQILDGARKVFMDLGFDGASMGEIARACGVSKGTLYVYFADKYRLFEAILEEEQIEQGRTAFNFDPARDPETTLREFGRAYITVLCRPGGGSAIRTVMAIAERMPEVGRRYYENVLDLSITRLAAYLEAHVGQGNLAISRLPPRRLAIHDDVPGRAVPALRLPGFTGALPCAHPRGGGERGADVSGGVSGEVSKRRLRHIAQGIDAATEPARGAADPFP